MLMSTSGPARRHWAGIVLAATLAFTLALVYWTAATTHQTPIETPPPIVSFGTPIHLTTLDSPNFTNSVDGPLFQFSNLKPGDTGTSGVVTITSNEPTAAAVSVEEQNFADTGGVGSQLALQITQTDASTHPFSWSGSFNGLYSSDPANPDANAVSICGNGTGCAWLTGESHSFKFKVAVPSSLTNAYQGKSASTDVVWNAAAEGSNINITRSAGNVKVQPGDYLAAGWSFQIASSHPQTNVTIRYGQVILQVSCQNGATPSPSEITIPLASGYPQPQTYTVDPAGASQWYPNTNGAAHESYENLQQPLPAPALCGGSTMIVKTAIFSANVLSTPLVPTVNVRFHWTDGGSVDCSNGAINPGAGTAGCNGGWSTTLSVTPSLG
jgi:hypothetical protein